MKHRPIGDVDILVQRQLDAAVRDRCSLLPTFHDLPRDARRRLVAAWVGLPFERLRLLDGDAPRGPEEAPGEAPDGGGAGAMRDRLPTATTFDGIEVIANLRINGRDLLAPMAAASPELAREISRGALAARSGDGIAAHLDAVRQRCDVQCRIAPATLGRVGVPDREIAGRITGMADRLRSVPALAAEPRRLALATAEAVGAAVASRWSAADDRPTDAATDDDWLPRAWREPEGALVVRLSVPWRARVVGAAGAPTHANLGPRILGAHAEHDPRLVSASAGLARTIAWLIDAGAGTNPSEAG